MTARNIIITLSTIFLLASIPVAVFLVRQQQNLSSQAYIPVNIPKIDFSGSNVRDYRTSSKDVTLTISYPKGPLTPTSVRVANSIDALQQAESISFTPPATNIPWQLQDIPGSQTVYAQFYINNLWQSPLSTSIILE